jgi:hypothetical protein
MENFVEGLEHGKMLFLYIEKFGSTLAHNKPQPKGTE